MNPPSIDVDGLGPNLSCDSYQTQTAQEGYRNGRSESLSASDNSKSFAICFSSLLSAPPQAPAAPPAQMGHRPLRGAILTLAKGAGLRLDWLVFVQEPLVGRGTCLARATATHNWNTTGSDTTDGGYVVEDNDVVEVSHPNTTEDTGTTGHRDTAKDYEKLNHTWLIKRLPDILHCKALKLTPDNFRLAEHLKRDKNHNEDQILHAMLMTELFPITELKTSDEVIPAIRDIFKCKFPKTVCSTARLKDFYFFSLQTALRKYKDHPWRHQPGQPKVPEDRRQNIRRAHRLRSIGARAKLETANGDDAVHGRGPSRAYPHETSIPLRP
jgi:hypothetical protein